MVQAELTLQAFQHLDLAYLQLMSYRIHFRKSSGKYVRVMYTPLNPTFI